MGNLQNVLESLELIYTDTNKQTSSILELSTDSNEVKNVFENPHCQVNCNFSPQ